jgi:hypothetical protein
MAYIAFLLLAAAVWFYAAADLQNHGHAWADRTCSSLPSLCNSPASILAGAAIAILLFVADRIFKAVD